MQSCSRLHFVARLNCDPGGCSRQSSIQDMSIRVIYPKSPSKRKHSRIFARGRRAAGGNIMIAIRKRLATPLDVVARYLLAPPVLAFSVAALLLMVATHSPARAQAGGDAIYGVTALDVAPSAAAQGVALLRQYRDGAL